MKMQFVFVSVFLFATSSHVFASSFDHSFYFNSLLSPEVQSVNDGGTSTSAVQPKGGFKLDSRTTLGFLVSEKVFLGGAFNFQSDSLKRPEVLGIRSEEFSSSQLEVGPAIGFTSDGFHGSFAYFLYGSQNSKSYEPLAQDEESKFSGVSGWQLIAGYNFQLSPALSVGPALVYRTVSYKKESLTDHQTPANNYSDREFTTEKNDSRVKPMISVMLKF